jgi:hypothetical protein
MQQKKHSSSGRGGSAALPRPPDFKTKKTRD